MAESVQYCTSPLGGWYSRCPLEGVAVRCSPPSWAQIETLSGYDLEECGVEAEARIFLQITH